MGQKSEEADLKPRAAKQMATKAKIGPPVVERNMPVAAMMSAPATQSCGRFQRDAPAAARYMPTMEIVHGTEFRKPTCRSVRSPIFRMMLGSQKVAA